jgi:hypothetical protein
MNGQNNNDITIVRRENVQMIAQSAPEVYNSNTVSAQKCNDYGQRLLDQIKAEGMTDELDQQCATYITKARNTVKKMNTNRSAITKLFDQIRSEFTTMENSIDPTKADTIPYLIQQQRNAYATQKRAEQERKQREEMLRQQRERAYSNYKTDVADNYKRAFNDYVNNTIDSLKAFNDAISLDNYDVQYRTIKSFRTDLPEDFKDQLATNFTVSVPAVISDMKEQLTQECDSIATQLLSQFAEQFAFEVGDYRASILDTLPSKKAELERLAKADAEEKQRMEAEIKAREAAEAERIEKERQHKAEEEEAKRKMQQEAAEVGDLFSAQAVVTPAGYQSKASVKKCIVFHEAQGILAAVSLWWSKEGQFLPLEDLQKTFKKQITFCEKLANDKAHPEFISSSSVSYEETVKAK